MAVMEIAQNPHIPVLPDTGQVPRNRLASRLEPFRTNVATEQAVEQTRAGDGSDFDLRQGQDRSRPALVSDFVERHLSIDPQTRAVVSQVFDRATGDLMSQVPDEALLRLKLFAREMAARLDAEQTDDREHIERIA